MREILCFECKAPVTIYDNQRQAFCSRECRRNSFTKRMKDKISSLGFVYLAHYKPYQGKDYIVYYLCPVCSRINHKTYSTLKSIINKCAHCYRKTADARHIESVERGKLRNRMRGRERAILEKEHSKYFLENIDRLWHQIYEEA